LLLITVRQVIGTVRVAHRRRGGHDTITVVLDDGYRRRAGGETVGLGIGGTDYEIDLSDRGRIRGSISSAIESPREDGGAGLTHR